MINFLFCTVLPPGVAKIFQIRKIQRFDKFDTDISDLIIECFGRDESCQKGHLNNLYLDDKFPILHCSLSGSLQS